MHFHLQMELYKHNYTRRHREKGRKLHLLVERQWMVTTNVLCWQLKHREQPCQRCWGFLKWWTMFGKVPEETKCNLTWICRVAVSLKILVGAKKKKKTTFSVFICKMEFGVGSDHCNQFLICRVSGGALRLTQVNSCCIRLLWGAWVPTL